MVGNLIMKVLRKSLHIFLIRGYARIVKVFGMRCIVHFPAQNRSIYLFSLSHNKLVSQFSWSTLSGISWIFMMQNRQLSVSFSLSLSLINAFFAEYAFCPVYYCTVDGPDAHFRQCFNHPIRS